MPKHEPIVLGEWYRDTITGYEGCATARFEYLFGCVRVQLEGGVEDEQVFDEQRLENLPPRQPVDTQAGTGGPHPKPPRATTR